MLFKAPFTFWTEASWPLHLHYLSCYVSVLVSGNTIGPGVCYMHHAATEPLCVLLTLYFKSHISRHMLSPCLCV